MSDVKRIIAVDPGYHTGYAILESCDNHIRLLCTGEVFVAIKMSCERLWPITRELIDIIYSYSPSIGIIETTFVNQNPFSSLKLGIAKGASLVAFEQCDLKYQEISATKVRKKVMKKGNVSKFETQEVIKSLFGQEFSCNSADSIAIGLSFLCEKDQEEYKYSIV